jgi:acetyl-CoA C-acetyltransferase
MGVADKVMGLMTKQITVSDDEGIRAGTTYDGIKGLRSALPGGLVSAGNASQLSDGSGAVVVMNEKLAEQKGLKPLGRFLGFAVAGCEPDEMGIGPVFAIPKVLKRLGLTMNDIDLWELNEAFAVQVIYCRDKLGIPADRLNVNGGAIAVGHPFGMSGQRLPATRSSKANAAVPSGCASPCVLAAAWAQQACLKCCKFPLRGASPS